MWWLCAVSALLLARAPPAGGATCDGERPRTQLDLPQEDVYTCGEEYIPLPRQVLPSIASVYEQENTSPLCMDTAIVYKAAIPNSGAHRPTWAKYGEYIYCPPQQWVHNLQHGAVAFLYHPCVHPKLKDALSSLARRLIPMHIITPLQTLSRDRPLALAAWCSTLEMSHINRTEVIAWLQEKVYMQQQDKTEVEEGSYQHLLIRPSSEAKRSLRVLDFDNKGRRLRRHIVKKRRRRLVLAVTPVVQKDLDINVSHSTTTSSIPTRSPTRDFGNNQTVISNLSVTPNISSVEDPVTSGPPVYLPQEPEADDLKAEIHSRGLEVNPQDRPPNTSVPAVGSVTPSLSGQNLDHSVVENASQDLSRHSDKEELPNSAGTEHEETKKSKVSPSPVTLSRPTSPTIKKSTEQLVLPSEKPQTESKDQKKDCKCQQDTTLPMPVQAQRRLGASQQKNSGVYVSTPRTEEAKWAAASLILLFALLTFSVLYTQIYKKFRKSQSLYWNSESHSEEKESVASIIKRRLVQGHTIRKKWIGRKKSPVVLYESLSESSD